MHYWNKANFKGLKDIGEAYKSKPGYEGFASYCLRREKGLKKQALSALHSFIAGSTALTDEAQREIACELAELYFRSRDQVHQLIPQPLLIYLKGVFTAWSEEFPNSAVPYRWLAVIGGDTKF